MTKVKLELLTDIDLFLVVEERITELFGIQYLDMQRVIINA